MQKRKKGLITLFFITIIALYFVIEVLPNVTGALKKTEIIQYGGIQVTDHVTAYVVRDEKVYLANKSGGLVYYVEEGEQVRKGIRILDITLGTLQEEDSSYSKIQDRIQRFNGGESIFVDDVKKINAQLDKLTGLREEALKEKDAGRAASIELQISRLNKKKQYISAADEEAKKELVNQVSYISEYGMMPQEYISESNGVISYYIDGYESEFTPDNMGLLTQDKIKNLDIEVQNLSRETTLTKEPLYKIVDNNQWYVTFWVAPENIVKYQKGKTAYINLPLGQVEGKIHDIIDDGDQWQVILNFNRYYQDFAQIRKIDAEVITSDYKGLTIRNESITTEDGQPGVYVKDKSGEYVFKPIKIITSDGEWSLVEVSYFYIKEEDETKKVDTVNIYDEILRKPSQR